MESETILPIQEILRNLKSIHLPYYFLCAFLLNVVVRVILTGFKALAISNGEIDEEWDIEWRVKGFTKAFSVSFWSNQRDMKIDDCWIPFLIGFAELIVFPILMSEGL